MKLHIPQRTNLNHATAQLASDTCFAVLDDNRTAIAGPSHIFTGLVEIVTAHRADEVDAAVSKIQLAVNQGLHAVGFYSYELGYCLIPKLQCNLPSERNVPLLMVGLFQQRRECRDQDIEQFLQERSGQDAGHVFDAKLNMSEAEYLDAIAQIHHHIYEGNTYQVNFTLKYKFKFSGNAAALYAALRRRQRVEYGAYLCFPGLNVLSRSPELFIRKEGDRLEAKPMKGTSKRGKTVQEDLEMAAFLLADEKSRAENVMIVDLLRNDLSRVAKNVSTQKLFEVQTYETLHQMISTITGTVERDIDLKVLLRELFPCGSITGAPKIRTMEIIRELEKEPRGIYTGAIGYLSPGQDLRFNVPIRTVVLWPDGSGEMGVGSGIVHDSDARAEFQECILKGKFLTEGVAQIELIEALRFDGRLHNVQAHLHRLENSAKTLGFNIDTQKVMAELDRAVQDLSQLTKVRILLQRDGGVRVECLPIKLAPANVSKRIAVAPGVVQSKNILLYHKTTCRQLYDDTYRRYAQQGFYDVLFCNEKGEITEGSYHNVFLEKDGVWRTPSVSCGLLPGIERQRILASKEAGATEAILRLEDLQDADRIYLTNSVRGIVEVTLEQLEEPTSCHAY